MTTTQINFHGDDVEQSSPAKAFFHIIPAPYEKTVSYRGGTQKGPQAILEASCQLELFDGSSIPAAYGIHTKAPINCLGAAENVLSRITASATSTLNHHCIPIILGGEHTITLASVRALKKKYNDFGVIQFDAHADLRESYNDSHLSHACVMKRLFDENIPFFQIGTRSYSYEEQLFRKEQKIPYFDAETIFREGIDAVRLPDKFPEKIFITFDIDCFDPALIPATGTPVPGGLTWYQVNWLLKKIFNNYIILGFDLVELAPLENLHSSSFTAAQLIYNMMGFLTRSHINQKFWHATLP